MPFHAKQQKARADLALDFNRHAQTEARRDSVPAAQDSHSALGAGAAYDDVVSILVRCIGPKLVIARYFGEGAPARDPSTRP